MKPWRYTKNIVCIVKLCFTYIISELEEDIGVLYIRFAELQNGAVINIL